ncbi:MAG: TRAP transporter small permease [Fusobacteriaceae bacterium]|jgi:TRAP-type C4-dicarboxylate transport system permease small subunit|nr:TRAP transporter small permease [Fusobacteriaceae bacterium]
MVFLKWLDEHFEETALSIFLIVLVILTSINVILRYVFNSGLTWNDEICKYCLIFSGFISIGYWIRHKNGICVDTLVQILPSKYRKILLFMTQLVVLIFFCILFFYSVNVLKSVAKSKQISGTLQISMVYVYMAPVIGFALAVIRIFQVLILGYFVAESVGSDKK